MTDSSLTCRSHDGAIQTTNFIDLCILITQSSNFYMLYDYRLQYSASGFFFMMDLGFVGFSYYNF